MDDSISLRKIKPKAFKVKLKCKTSLLMNKFSDLEKKRMLDKDLKKMSKKAQRDIEQEVDMKIHKMLDGSVGFPVAGFKAACVMCWEYMETKFRGAKRLLLGGFQIIPDEGNLVKIKYKKMLINESVACNPKTGAVINFRPEFVDWSVTLTISYDDTLLSAEQIINLLNLAGFHIGVGSWRPNCSGNYGMFEVCN